MKTRPEEKIKDLSTLADLLTRLRQEGKRLVLTNGCFDLLHQGHVLYLSRAAEMGDLLVVGVNSDASVRALKGEKRPLLPEKERAFLVAALACVDYVVLFGEKTAANLVETLKPDVYVKGGDYGNAAAVPEAPLVEAYGGRVALAPQVEGISTSALIQRILARYTYAFKG